MSRAPAHIRDRLSRSGLSCVKVRFDRQRPELMEGTAMAGMVTIFHAGWWPGIAASCICMAELAEGAARRRTGRQIASALGIFQPRPALVSVPGTGRRTRPIDFGYHC